MESDVEHQYVSLGGAKLEFALRYFGIDITGQIAADLGCHIGGFVDCLLRYGAQKVFAFDTGYGVL
ncbi:MAG: TlyA family rRNA (cytidine-2'-O)-methyltransferase, partial [Candidatus Latescibacteria bacterium]|nr:TlyA family rRNA (cytidine-2'-O)-methyltransferase [Candidatus Latescibacterota bacterium]